MHVRTLSAQRYNWPVWLKLWASLFIIALCCTLYAFPRPTFYAVGIAFSLLIILHSFLRLWACLISKPSVSTAHGLSYDYPPYTVLVPLMDEAHMVPSLMTALSKFDYPKDKLQILLITESHDPATTDAVKAFLKAPFESIVVPTGGPKTKPNALNYAMKYARGEIITIYDAEDHPHPQQLKHAAKALFENPKWGAAQAPLDYYNRSETWLTRQFALEYAALFHVWVPFLAKLKLPFPLGGTSNHMSGLM